MRILAGDIGGTNTRLAYVDDVEPAIRKERSYASANYSNLHEAINDFLSYAEVKKPVDAACLAVAGPVIGDCASLTNLPWRICKRELEELLQTKCVSLINDLAAMAYAIPGLKDEDIMLVQPGKTMPDHPVMQGAAIIAAGTGLGAAHLVWLGDSHKAFSSEAGHAGFAPETAMQERLLNWLHKEHTHVSVEMLLSGTGIFRIYQFFRDAIGLAESKAIRRAIHDGDPAQVISEYALLGGEQLCLETMNCFVDIYGAVAGDIALHYFPLDAVYLTGGIAPKIKSFFTRGGFIRSFTNKGPMNSNLQNIPVKLILSDRVGLDGSIARAKAWMQTAG